MMTNQLAVEDLGTCSWMVGYGLYLVSLSINKAMDARVLKELKIIDYPFFHCIDVSILFVQCLFRCARSYLFCTYLL